MVGGLTSPGGAVLGGFAVGVIENLAGTYIPYVGRELKLTIALVLIVAVLVVKPSGLFGRAGGDAGLSLQPRRDRDLAGRRRARQRPLPRSRG